MREIDNYIDSLYKHVDVISKENKEFKEAMKEHLKESVEELKLEGYSEEESIKIALERFGDVKEIRGDLETVVEKGMKPLMCTVGISMVILLAFFIYLSVMKFNMIKILALAVIAIPMYIVIRGGILIFYKAKGINYNISWKKEFYKFLFSNYIILLIGWYMFPLNFGETSYINFQIDLIPFKGFIELMSRGITPLFIIKNLLIRLVLFMPLGFYPAFIKGKFNNILTCIVLGSLIYCIVPIVQFLLSFGVISIHSIYFGIDYWFVSVLGVLFGYFLYNHLRVRRK